MSSTKNELLEKGYCIVPNVLSHEEVNKAKELFYTWKKTVPNHDKIHNLIDPHGIYKFHEVGHQEHAWYIRTRPQIIDIYKKLWDSDELIVSFDGSCYISKDTKKQDKIWTHTDQDPNSKGLHCYQGFVSLTDNKERTLVVYEGSHNYHEKYFEEKNIKSSKKWQLIDHDKLNELNATKRVLEVPAGSLVIWDSRTFHQNQYGAPNSEERIVQYVCYLPKSHQKNTQSQIKKRLKYFEERRTTSHWPCPIKVNGLQPQTYGDKSKEINYELMRKPDLTEYLDIIKTLI
jgi:ectoine hydroxylase-related dioxygenase (phytanoyl-CoA dioxygenase family)